LKELRVCRPARGERRDEHEGRQQTHVTRHLSSSSRRPLHERARSDSVSFSAPNDNEITDAFTMDVAVLTDAVRIEA
jgi:hypothetical protein